MSLNQEPFSSATRTFFNEIGITGGSSPWLVKLGELGPETLVELMAELESATTAGIEDGRGGLLLCRETTSTIKPQNNNTNVKKNTTTLEAGGRVFMDVLFYQSVQSLANDKWILCLKDADQSVRPKPELFTVVGCKFQFDAGIIKPPIRPAERELAKL